MSLRRDFWQIQQAQLRRSLLLLTLLGAVYFLSAASLLLVFAPLVGVLHRDGSWGLWQGLLASFLFAGGLLAIQLAVARNSAVAAVERALHLTAPDEEDRYHRRFANTVEEMAIAAGLAGRVGARVMPAMTLNAFAAEDRRSGPIVGVSEGLLARLDRPQLQAVVAHEVSHIRHGDARLAALLLAMQEPFLALARMLDKLGEDEEHEYRIEIGQGAVRRRVDAGAGTAENLVLLLVMRFFSTALSRRREYMADAGAAELTRNPLALAEALERIAGGHHFLGGQASAFAPIFIVSATTSPLSEDEGLWSDLFSTHPPIRKRLENLVEMGADYEGPTAEPGGAAPGGRRYSVRQADGWSPPLPLDQLLALPGIGPETWLVREGLFKPFKLRADEGLMQAISAPPADQDQAAAEDAESPLARPLPAREGGGKCPHCFQPLGRIEYEGVAIEHCEHCDGHFVEDGKLRRIIARREVAFTDDQLENARRWQADNPFLLRSQMNAPQGANALGKLRCPRCGLQLIRRYFNYQFALVVDRCLNCRGNWFDRGELELLQMLYDLPAAKKPDRA